MKRFLIGCLAALTLAGTAVAQTSPAAGPQAGPQAGAQSAPQSITVSGKLEVVNGMIGLRANGVSYYIPRLRQLVGFVKEIQEGASVKIVGYAFPIPSQTGYSMFELTKLTIGSKDYDFDGAGYRGYGRMGARGARGGMWGEQRGQMGPGAWGGQRW